MAKDGKPLISNVTAVKQLGNEQKKDQNRWSFSFLYFKQIDLFGVDGCPPKWFVGLLERLQDMSSKTPELLKKPTEKNGYRCHPINWDSKNVPLKREDFNWVPKQYLENEAEFPFVQFSISKANGRVVGFLNEDSTIFFILLLDPKHNLQPSKNFGHKINSANPLESQYDDLISGLDNLKVKADKCKKKHEAASCELMKEVLTLEKKQHVIYLTLDDDFCDIYQEHKNEIKELVEKFLLEKI